MDPGDCPRKSYAQSANGRFEVSLTKRRTSDREAKVRQHRTAPMAITQQLANTRLLFTRQHMSSPQRMWRNYIDAWNRHDVDAILASVTDDFIYDERPAMMDRPLQGRPAFRVYLERTFTAFPDLRIDLTSCDAGSALDVSESVMRGAHLGRLDGMRATRKRITARVACVFEVRDGKLAHERLDWDRANTVRQLGRLPAMLAVALKPPVSEAALLRSVEKRPSRLRRDGADGARPVAEHRPYPWAGGLSLLSLMRGRTE